MQTFDGLMVRGNSFTMMSTAAGIDLLIDHANRLTEIEAVSENCGVYMRLELVVDMGISPII